MPAAGEANPAFHRGKPPDFGWPGVRAGQADAFLHSLAQAAHASAQSFHSLCLFSCSRHSFSQSSQTVSARAAIFGTYFESLATSFISASQVERS